MRRDVLLLSILSLGGLLTACEVAPLQAVKVPIPVECRAQVPARPAMPTETLLPGVNLDKFAASALAEIEIRQGYEVELKAALDSCLEPIRR